MATFPKIGDKLMIFNDANNLEIFREGKVYAVNGSEIDIEFQDCIKKFFIDINSKTLFNNEGSFNYETLVNVELMTLLLDGRTVEQTVIRLVNFERSECRCINCITSELDFLSQACLSIQNDACGRIVILYIETIMIPQLLFELRSYLLHDNINDVLQRSFEDQQSQNKCVSESNLQKIVDSQKLFDKSRYQKGCSCMFCLEEFAEIKRPKIIECPNCQATFCTGIENCSDECCKGIRYHLKNDNRCPVCRLSADDWVKKIAEEKAESETPVTMEDFFRESTSNKRVRYYNVPDKFFSKKKNFKQNFYHRQFSRRQLYGMKK